MERLTQQQLKQLLAYDPDTGAFTWLKPTSNRVKPGALACSVNTVGYVRIGIGGKRYAAHRLAWLYVHGVWPENEIDHINRNRQDNRICNLRDVNSQQNKLNSGVRRNNTSGVKGVSWDKKSKRWRVQARINGQKTYIGVFDTLEEATTAYQKAAVI